MAYFEASYYTSYFDIGAATQPAVVRVYGGDWPSPKQWKRYLKKINEAQKERMAAKVADRQNLRKMILDQILPSKGKQIIVRTNPKPIEPLPKGEEPRYEVRQIRLPYIPDAEAEIRRRLAAEIRDIRRRAKRIKERKKREAVLKKLREEEALIALFL